MKRLLLIAMIAMLLISACTVNTGVPQAREQQEEYTGLTTKVAILPLKTMDGRCKNIRKILFVRDFYYVFSEYPQYELLDLNEVAREYRETGFLDVDDLNIDEMEEIADATDANVLILGNISSLRADLFSISVRFFSARTQELRQINFNVDNHKEARWDVLRKRLIAELDTFISQEVDKIYNVATNFYAAGNYVEAERQLKVAIGLDPDKADAYYYLGATYLKTGAHQLAEENFRNALEINPKHGQSLIMLNELYETTDQVAKRLEVMEMIATNNDDAELWFVIGNIYAEQRQFTDAESAFDSSLSISPEDIRVITRKGLMLYELERFGDAIEYLETAYDAYPENEIISRRLAAAYQRSGRMDQAINRYEGLIRSNPNNTQAYLNLVGLYRNQASEAEDTELRNEYLGKAINTMNNLITIAPDNPMAYLNLASIYILQEVNDKAELNANKVISYDPTIYQAYVILATISQMRGTNEYNRFVDLEKRAEAAVGRQATTLARERDGARTSANNHFRRAAEQLYKAGSVAADPDTQADINNRLSTVNNLINQTKGF
ncbi:MAG TPA: tetratricopeptide repeat protein [Candidatus Cloacimonetes bacterium]|nr:tetratricopeptide repeat protein [Candidatus Cloacimonadota bacterium]